MRLEALDQERAVWDGRMNEYLQQRDAILKNQALSEQDRQKQVNDIKQKSLDQQEQIQKISLLADDTILCPAHEYTLSNLQFALVVEPNNQDNKDYQQQCLLLRQQQLPTLPTLLGKENF